MKVIGLTGGIACGKTTVANMIRARGIPVIDADILVGYLYMPHNDGWKAIKNWYGERVLDEDGKIDRDALSLIALSTEEEREKLNSLIHPLVNKEVKMLLKTYENNGVGTVVYDCPLLFETDAWKLVDCSLCIGATRELQEKRIRKRNPDWSQEKMHQIQNAQLAPHIRAKAADYVIPNESTKLDLEKEVERVLKEIGI